MIVIKLTGGMGNQMFQYACGRALAIKNNVQLKLDLSFYEHNFKKSGATPRKYELGIFGIDRKLSSKEMVLIKILKTLGSFIPYNSFYKEIIEKNPYLADTPFPIGQNLYISGYFQSENYFSEIKEIIKSDFTFSSLIHFNSQLYDRILLKENSVGVLVRRDDFISSNLDQTVDLNYFKRAFNEIKSKLSNPFFFVFTIGDTDWSKNLLKFDDNIEIVENDTVEMQGFDKMRLMSLCKHNIIANSSFGWWSAWLNENPNKIVIYPEKWHYDDDVNTEILRDRFPKDWIKI
jgi:hypothetical protein